jgi:hypothetical protein
MNARRIPPLMRRGGRFSAPVGAAAPALEAPETISGLLAWFDPSINVTKAGTPERVSSHISREGNEYEILQASGPAQFLWSATGILGNPAFYGDGARYLDGVVALGEMIDGSAPHSIVFVCDRDTTTSFDTVFAIGAEAGTSVSFVRPAGTNFFNHSRFRADGGTSSYASTAAATASPSYHVLTYDGTNSAWRSNGVSGGSGANAIAQDVACVRTAIGARRFNGTYASFMTGWIGDVLVYDHVLTVGEITTLEDWISAKYVGI